MYLPEKNYAAALSDAEEAVRLEADDASTLHARGKAWENMGDLKAAGRDYDEALRLTPDHWSALDARARLRCALGDRVGALKDLEAALQSLPPFFQEWRERLEKELVEVKRELGW